MATTTSSAPSPSERSILLAGNAQKATAIRSALRTGLIDMLVTNDQAAELLLS